MKKPMRMIRQWCLALALSATAELFAIEPSAPEWPQFRGPTGQGLIDVKGLPVTWSENENVVWKTPIPGKGWSSPVVAGSRVWMTTATKEGRSLRAVCVDRDSGKPLKDVEVFHFDTPIPVNAKNSHASPSPVTDGHRLYVHFGTCGTAALNLTTGEVVWKTQEFQIDHKEGPGSSPCLAGDLLVIPCDGMDKQYMVAVETATGKVRWKTNRSKVFTGNPDFRKAYATPLCVDVRGKPQIVCPGSDRVSAYEPATGKEIWFVDYVGFSNVPRPLFAHGYLFISTGFTQPQMWAIRPEGAGDLTKTNVVWKFTRQVCGNSSPIIVGDYLYMASDQGVLTCLEAKTGMEKFKERLKGGFSASPLSADGLIYFFDEKGQTTVLRAKPVFEQVAFNRLPGRFMATPAVAGKAFFLRTDQAIYRVENKSGSSSVALDEGF